jgi:hypothetical protein
MKKRPSSKKISKNKQLGFRGIELLIEKDFVAINPEAIKFYTKNGNFLQFSNKIFNALKTAHKSGAKK